MYSYSIISYLFNAIFANLRLAGWCLVAQSTPNIIYLYSYIYSAALITFCYGTRHPSALIKAEAKKDLTGFTIAFMTTEFLFSSCKIKTPSVPLVLVTTMCSIYVQSTSSISIGQEFKISTPFAIASPAAYLSNISGFLYACSWTVGCSDGPGLKLFVPTY